MRSSDRKMWKVCIAANLCSAAEPPRTEPTAAQPPLPSPWGRWHGAVPWHCSVTDEGSPPSAGLTAVLAPYIDFSSAFSSAGRSLPLFFCNQKKSRKTVKEKFRPLPSRSRVRLPPKGGINAPPETERFLISTASPTGSRAVFQFPSDARPPKVLRTG